MHCTDATCEKLCPAGARVHLDYGAVGTDDEKCIGCQSCVVACPFGKPKYSEETNKAYKCNLCPDRVQNDLLSGLCEGLSHGRTEVRREDGNAQIWPTNG